MMIIVFFAMAFCALLFGMVSIYKVPERLSLLKSIVICFITELCFGAVIAEVYSLLGISICLMNMGIAYLVMGSVIWLIIVRQRKIQPLGLGKTDVYSFLVIGIGFLIIFLSVFTPRIFNVYINSDPASHYAHALSVLDTGKISSMYFAELYNGLVLEIFQSFIVRLNLYKAFIIADSCANLINIFMFYTLASTICKSRIGKLVTPFLSLLYFLGWPFFSYALGGFVYYGWGVTLFAYVVFLLMQLYESTNKRNQITLFLLIICGCYSTLVCYMLFVPILAFIVLIGFILVGKKNNIVISKKLKLGIIVGIILGAVIIFEICFLGFFGGDLTYVFSALKTDGWIHKELYRDFVVLMPAVLYMGWYYYKNKKVNFVSISANVSLLYILITFFFCLCGVLSAYYYYKPYYLLWFFAWLMCLEAMEHFMERDKAIVFIYGITMIFPMLMTLSGIDAKLAEQGIVYDESGNRHYPSLMPILDRNEYFLSNEERNLEDRNALLEVCDYINSQFSEEDKVTLITSDGCVENWYPNFTGKESISAMSGEDMQKVLAEYKEEGGKYIVIHKNTRVYQENEFILENFGDMYFDNGYYGVYMLK